jgi:hypothetical protein
MPACDVSLYRRIERLRAVWNIVQGVFTPVLAKHGEPRTGVTWTYRQSVNWPGGVPFGLRHPETDEL